MERYKADMLLCVASNAVSLALPILHPDVWKAAYDNDARAIELSTRLYEWGKTISTTLTLANHYSTVKRIAAKPLEVALKKKDIRFINQLNKKREKDRTAFYQGLFSFLEYVNCLALDLCVGSKEHYAKEVHQAWKIFYDLSSELLQDYVYPVFPSVEGTGAEIYAKRFN